MANDTMLNVRLDKTLKDHGCQILERNGVSVSTLVRAAFEYLEKNQALPPDLFPAQESIYNQRRRAMRQAVGAYSVEEGFDFAQARQEYRAARTAKAATGVRL